MGDYINNTLKTAMMGYTDLPRIDSTNAVVTAVGSVSTGLTDLMSITLTGVEEGYQIGGLPAAGQGIRIVATGTFASNGNTKTVTLLFGGTTLGTLTGAINGGAWRFDATVFRITRTTQTANVLIIEGTTPSYTLTNVAPAENVDESVEILVRGQATTTNDIVQTLLYVTNI